MQMELQLELALSSSWGEGTNQDCDRNRKHSFGDAFSDVGENVTLPFLKWDDMHQQINGELPEHRQIEKFPISSTRNAEVAGDILVGWPPVKSWRKQFCRHNGRRRCAASYVNVENGGGGGGRGANSMYVKVRMEGVGIARKVNLSIHHSYHALTANLIALFGKCEENVEKYKLTYQDKEGDWLVAGDFPWETFIQSVQRMKLQRSGY